jgi:hypothetical protein
MNSYEQDVVERILLRMKLRVCLQEMTEDDIRKTLALKWQSDPTVPKERVKEVLLGVLVK